MVSNCILFIVTMPPTSYFLDYFLFLLNFTLFASCILSMFSFASFLMALHSSIIHMVFSFSKFLWMSCISLSFILTPVINSKRLYLLLRVNVLIHNSLQLRHMLILLWFVTARKFGQYWYYYSAYPFHLYISSWHPNCYLQMLDSLLFTIFREHAFNKRCFFIGYNSIWIPKSRLLSFQFSITSSADVHFTG